MKSCPNCMHPADDTAKFCEECGSRIQEPEAAVIVLESMKYPAEMFSSWETKKLKEAATIKRSDYDSSSLLMIEEELTKRQSDDTVSCPRCASANQRASSFCNSCGFRLSSPDINASAGSITPYENRNQLVMKANSRIADQSSCGICRGRFYVGDDVIQCGKCYSYFHAACFNRNNGCNQPGCSDQSFATKQCPYCGQRIQRDAVKCKHCGSYVDNAVRQQQLPKGRAEGAVASLVCSIIGLFICSIILAPIAISQGNKAIRTINNDPSYTGKGMATAGVTIGIIDLCLWGIGILVYIIGSAGG